MWKQPYFFSCLLWSCLLGHILVDVLIVIVLVMYIPHQEEVHPGYLKVCVLYFPR